MSATSTAGFEPTPGCHFFLVVEIGCDKPRAVVEAADEYEAIEVVEAVRAIIGVRGPVELSRTSQACAGIPTFHRPYLQLLRKGAEGQAAVPGVLRH